MRGEKTLEIPILGMDCAECTRHVEKAIASLPGVETVEVYLASEKAVIRHQGEIDITAIRNAVANAGYTVGDLSHQENLSSLPTYSRPILTLLSLLFGVVLLVIVIGEWAGVFQSISGLIPWPISLAIVLLIGYPVFGNVLRATFQKQIISHTLMMVGVLAALAIGEWPTAAVVAFFMRIGDYVERFTTERARRAVRDLSAIAPLKARLERDGNESEIPIDQVRVGDVVVVRPGEQIPVDGEVVGGHATVNQATITGESMPAEVGPGSKVYAATFASQGSLRVRTTHVGQDTTFGKVIRLVEEAEAQRGAIQRLADRFSAFYLPIVLAAAGLTYFINHNPLAVAAILVVACSCAFALATPIAILASIGAAAQRGLLIKGGKYLEIIPQVDVLLIDKTGTLTLGKPVITDILEFKPAMKRMGVNQSSSSSGNSEILRLAASAERYSEHPLAEAVREAAEAQAIQPQAPEEFSAMPGFGVRARLNERQVLIGNRRLLEQEGLKIPESPEVGMLEAQGKSLLFLALDDNPLGALAAADTLRPEVPDVIRDLQALGLKHIELLTGDNPRNAAALANALGISFRAELLPEDKIGIVKEYQARGHKVMMIGDGVNDAPALAQADVGIAMGATGHGVAMEAAHVILLRDDWNLLPKIFEIARRTMRVVRTNLGLTALYNLLGLSLAAAGLLPPILAAAAQSLPDLGILVNSSRLLKQK